MRLLVLFFLSMTLVPFSAAQASTPVSLDQASVQKVKPGDVLYLNGVGDDGKSMEFFVYAAHIVKGPESTSYELEGRTSKRKFTVSIDVVKGNIEVSMSLRKLSLEALEIDGDRLDEFDSKEKGSFRFEGTKFRYDESFDVTFLRGGDPDESEKASVWQFENDDGSRFIGVIQWADDETYECDFSKPIPASEVSVLLSN